MKIIRLTNSSIIYPDLDPRIGANVNGPSLLRVPEWITHPPGRYYLYFAHHQGTFIRMAYADRIEGPYIVYSPGVLDLKQTPFARHIASPDVHVDSERRKIFMYYHGHGSTMANPLAYEQVTCYAESDDGLAFASDDLYLGPSYLRVFERDGWHYGFAGGPERYLYRTRNPRGVFEQGVPLEIEGEAYTDLDTLRRAGINQPTISRMRHAAFHLRGDALDIYYSNVGDAPERIKKTSVDLRAGWVEWRGARLVEVLHSEKEYEGVSQPVRRSSGGASHVPVHELRDPYLYEENGRLYLFYSVAGELGIAVAEIREE